jgi:hypothetical protein
MIEVINLTYDDDSDSKSDNINHTEVSWLRYTQRARHRVTLTSFFLIDHFRVADQSSLPPTVLCAKLTSILRRRPHNVIYSDHTWREEILMEGCLSVVLIAP